MSTTSARVGFVLPDNADNVDVDTQVTGNFDKIDATLGVPSYTSGTRPGTNNFPGRVIYETDSKRIMAYNGTTWNELASNVSGLLNAKGDLLVASAAGTLTNLAIGTNGHVLHADSSQPSGVKWGDPLSSLFTTKGDLVVASGVGTSARLGVGTDGQLLTADAASVNGLKWANMPSSGAMTKLDEMVYNTNSSDGSTWNTPGKTLFSNIDQGYSDLLMTWSNFIFIGSDAFVTWIINPNGVSSATYWTNQLSLSTSSSSVFTSTTSNGLSISMSRKATDADALTSTNYGSITIHGYSSSNRLKTMSADYLTYHNSSSVSNYRARCACTDGALLNPITSIKLQGFSVTGVYAGSKLELYGIK